VEGLRGPTGVGKGFAPSASAANKALGGTVRQGMHPAGLAGTNFSLSEMAKFIRDGRNDPRMRGWVGRVIIAAGKPKNVRAQAQAVLNELRKKTIYVQDPVNTEMIARPHVTLCLDDKGLCMPAVDCDDLVVAFASGMMSIGIETRIVGAAYGTPQATHVLCAIQDPEAGWLKVDPSSEFPVGQSYPATKEWWMDPISGTITENGKVTKQGVEPVNGDYVGVGRTPAGVPEGLGAGSPEGVGVVPFAHAFSPLTHGASYVPVGLERGCYSCFPEKQKPAQEDAVFPAHLIGL